MSAFWREKSCNSGRFINDQFDLGLIQNTNFFTKVKPNACFTGREVQY